MASDHFDSLTRLIASAPTRRTLLGLATALGFGPLLADAKKRRKKKRKKRKKRSCSPNCTDRTCGDDGCGGSCGLCFQGSCQAGVCICPTGEDVCNGTCVATCESFEERFPDTCVCCGTHNSPCGTPSHCCSNTCESNVCQGRDWLEDCTWDAQCASGICDAGKCTCGGEVCGGVCRPACSSQEARNPITCACCFTAGFGDCYDSSCDCCCSRSCGIPGGCRATPDGFPCDFSAQCASRFGCVDGTCGGVND
jgi:hypothetical protein